MTDTAADHALRRHVVAGVVFLSFLAMMNQLVIAPALPTIGAQLGDVDELPWLVTAYLFSMTIVTPLYGRLGDIYGRRTMIAVSVGFFALGSLLCAMAPTMLMLAFARAVQGIGGGGMVPLAQAAIADVVPPRERGNYQVYFSAVYIVGNITGPLFGGLIVEHLHWSWVFWINLPFSIITLVMTERALRRIPSRRRAHNLDLVGAALMTFLTLGLLLVLSWGGVRYAWTSPMILALLAVSGLCGAAYVVNARRVPEPLVPLSVLSDKVVAWCSVVAFFSAAAFTALLFYAPLYLQLVIGVSASFVGVAITAMTMAATILTTFSARIFAYGAWGKWFAIAVSAIGCAAVGVLAGYGVGSSMVLIIALLAAANMGTSAMYPPVNISIQNAVPHHHVGVATATIYFLRAIAGAFASAIAGAIFIAGGHDDTLHLLKDGAVEPGDPALAHTFSIILSVIAGFLVVSIAGLAAMEYRPLRKTIDD